MSDDDPRRRVPPGLVTASEVVLRAAVVVIGVIAAGWLFLYLRVVTVPAFLALLATAVLLPVKRLLVRRRVRPLLATWLVVAGTALVASAAVAALAPAVVDQFGELGEQIDEGIAEIEDWLATGPLGIEDVDLGQTVADLRDQVFAGGARHLVSGIALLGEIVAGALLAVVMTFFFLKDGERIVAAGRSVVPDAHRRQVEAAAGAAWRTLGGYIRGTAVVGTVDAAGIALGMLIIGVPLVLPIALLTFFGAFFPIVGAVVAGAVAVLVALVALGPAEALATLAVVVAVQQLESNFLSPVVMGRALKLHPLVILVALAAGAVAAGILGAFLAVPLVATAASVGRSLRDEPPPAE